MSNEDYFGKIKDRYIEAVCTVLPQSQVIFVLLAIVMIEFFVKGGAGSPVSAIGAVSLKSLFDFGGGKLWDVSVASFFIAVVAGLINKWVLRFFVYRSFAKGFGDDYVAPIVESTIRALKKVENDGEKASIASSIKEELDFRKKQYKSHRMICELFFGGFMFVIYGSLVAFHFGVWRFSFLDVACASFMGVACLFMHRFSIGYAIGKVMPLQLMYGAVTGEVVFLGNTSASSDVE